MHVDVANESVLTSGQNTALSFSPLRGLIELQPSIPPGPVHEQDHEAGSKDRGQPLTPWTLTVSQEAEMDQDLTPQCQSAFFPTPTGLI